MRKFDEHDIEKMLRKTEKTDPSFDKEMLFPKRKLTIHKRKRISAIFVAACVLVLTFAGSVLIIMNKSDVYIPEESFDYVSQDISVNNSTDVSKEFSEFSDEPDESRGIMNDSSNADNSEETDENQPVEYPESLDFFVGKGLGHLQAPEQYFAANPHEYLASKSELPVYTRTPLTFEECGELLYLYGVELNTEFVFDEVLYNITGNYKGVSDNEGLSINISEFGDWYLNVSNVMYLRVKISNDDLETSLINGVKDFVNQHSGIFSVDEYEYRVRYSETRVKVELYEKREDDYVLSNIVVGSFSFKLQYGSTYTLTSIERTSNGLKSVGNYELRDYEAAVEDLLNNNFWYDYEIDIPDGGILEFKIIGYDVRYLQSSKFDIMCPYYAFVINTDDEDDGRSLTVFVPAISDEFIVK
jgi:hypothetical protein